MFLEPAQLEQIENHITEILPQLLRRNPEIATTIEGILAQHFPRRDEFARLLDELAEHRAETSARFKHIDDRFDRVDADIKDLKTDVAVLKTDVAGLKTDVAGLKTEMQEVRTELREVKTDVADLKGSDLEWQFRERPFAYLSRFARRLRPVTDTQLAELVEDGLDRGALPEAEAEELRLLDAVAVGRSRRGDSIDAESEPVYLAVEVSWVIDDHDLQRAVRRARLLEQLTGCRTLPIVAGQRILDAVRTEAERIGAGWLIRPS